MLMIYGFAYNNRYIPTTYQGHIDYLLSLHSIQELLDPECLSDNLYCEYMSNEIYNAGFACGYVRLVSLIDTLYCEGMKCYVRQMIDLLTELADSENLILKCSYMDAVVIEQYPLLFLGSEV